MDDKPQEKDEENFVKYATVENLVRQKQSPVKIFQKLQTVLESIFSRFEKPNE